MVELLIKAKADVNAKDKHGKTVLSQYGDREDLKEIIEILKKAGAKE